MRLSSAVSVFLGTLLVVTGVSCGSGGGKTPAPTTPPAGGTNDTWSIGNDRVRLVVKVDAVQGLRVEELRNLETNKDWSKVAQADTTITLNGSAAGLGTSDGFKFTAAERSTDGSGSELRLSFDHAALRIRATRHYICYTGAPVIETFTVLEGIGGTATVGPINAWRLSVPAGEIRWLTGLDAPAAQGGGFTLERRTLSSLQRMELSSEGRSTESAVPWLTIESGGEHFFGGVMWSGAWSMTVMATGDRQEVIAGLPVMTTALANGASIEGPHGFFGVVSGGAGAVSRGMRDFFHYGIRLARPLQPLVTYNTWFARGAAIDELTTREDIEHAAALHAEVFVMDAGWWLGAAAIDPFDFTSGLGRWVADPERFPSGLRGLRDYAHSLGLKFGIWMEPERVALEVLGEEGMVDERWLAARDGRYDPNTPPEDATSAQICLGHAEARVWVREAVFWVIDQAQPDYLKWDNNFWVNCNRSGHGHGATDGNFAHVRGLYEILAAVRERYPDLIIENCSGGGHRLDFGLARYTDVAWMDDRTTPSSRVRHDLEGLTAAFPAPYLFSFVLGEVEDGSGGEDIPLLYRSRMPGVLGIGTGMSREQEERAAGEIARYRGLRDLQVDAATILLTPQAGSANGPGWDALEQISASGDALVFAFQTDPAVQSIVLSPRALTAEALYSVESADSGHIGEARGADIMEQGIEVVASPATAGHLLILHLVSAGEGSRATAANAAGAKSRASSAPGPARAAGAKAGARTGGAAHRRPRTRGR